ncbi:MAG TPA: glycosyltransferase family 39 protein [Polyangiaceae bacterium]|nr:glycosyltransferase family 39 protein [Polyangiaceae bacterium]
MDVATTETTRPNVVGDPHSSASVGTSITPSTWAERAALVIALAAAAHWIVGATTGLSDTEAYYAEWARVPALSYYDHPPLVAWTTWLVTRVSGAPWAIRSGPVLYAIAFDALVYRLTARLFSPRAGFLAVCILTAVPVIFFTGFLLNPEGLLAPLWTLFLVLLLSLRDDDAPWRPLAIGAVVGVGFLAKYTAILAVPVALLTLAVSPPRRRWLRRSSLYLGGVVALAIATPVIGWNALNHWPSVHLHLSERLAQSSGESLVSSLWRVGRGQLLYFQPLLLPMLGAVLCAALARSRRDDRYRFLATTSVPVLAFVLTAMVRAQDSEPHWTLVGYVPLIVAAGGLIDESTVGCAVSRRVF